MKEPLVHSHIEDGLPDWHPVAYEIVNCCKCGADLHMANNECMQTWVETGNGNYCVKCFSTISGIENLDDSFGLQ